MECAIAPEVSDMLLLPLASRSGSHMWGKTDGDCMHALMVPDDDRAPELKTISLSWTDARAVPDKKWEEDHGSMNSCLDEDSDMGSDKDPDEDSSHTLP